MTGLAQQLLVCFHRHYVACVRNRRGGSCPVFTVSSDPCPPPPLIQRTLSGWRQTRCGFPGPGPSPHSLSEVDWLTAPDNRQTHRLQFDFFHRSSKSFICLSFLTCCFFLSLFFTAISRLLVKLFSFENFCFWLWSSFSRNCTSSFWGDKSPRFKHNISNILLLTINKWLHFILNVHFRHSTNYK